MSDDPPQPSIPPTTGPIPVTAGAAAATSTSPTAPVSQDSFMAFQRQVLDSQTLIINHLSALTARLGAIEVQSAPASSVIDPSSSSHVFPSAAQAYPYGPPGYGGIPTVPAAAPSLPPAAVARRPSPSAPPLLHYGLPWFGGIPVLRASVPVIPEVFSAPHVLPASSVPGPFLQPVNWLPPQPASRLLTAEESSNPGLLPTTPSLIPSFTAPMPVPPQQRCDGVFYEGVDGIRASTTQLQAAARCLLPRRQGQRPIFKRRRPVVPATLQQLAKRKAIARASACKVSAAVRLQAVARGLLVRRQTLGAALVAVDLGTRGRDLAQSDDHQQPRRPGGERYYDRHQAIRDVGIRIRRLKGQVIIR